MIRLLGPLLDLRGLLLTVVIASVLTVGFPRAFAATDTIGGTSVTVPVCSSCPGYVFAFPITITGSGTLQTIGINWAGTQSGNVRVALYSAGTNKPANLLSQSAGVPMSTTIGWQDVSVSSYSVAAGSYWVALHMDSSKGYYYSPGTEKYYQKAYGPFDSVWTPTTGDSSATINMRVTYSSGPDFTISATPTSQNIAAGGTATFTLNLASSGGFSGTVNLGVTSGCPSGVTCTVTPSSVSTYPTTATLSVPTLITTTGTYNVIVTATDGSITHTVTATVSVTGPNSYTFKVRPGATQIVVTGSWTGTATASVTIAGPGGSPTLSESAGVIYDRTSISVSGGTSTTSSIHRVTFTIAGPASQETWTLLLSISGTSNYNVAIEVI